MGSGRRRWPPCVAYAGGLPVPAAPNPVRVAIVGAGNVGAAYAYALLLSGLAAEIVLINRNREDAEGEAMDLAHAAPHVGPVRVWAGDYADCAGAEIVVLTLGAPQGDRPDRLALVRENGEIFKEIVPEIVRHNPEAVLLVASNPVDVLTWATWKLSGLPRGRVIGSGCVLDTARLRAQLGEHLGVDPRDVQADVVGEHGDSQVPVWSRAAVAGLPLPEFAAALGRPDDGRTRADIAERTRTAGAAVAERKGHTAYGVAVGLLRITEAVLRDERSLLMVSTALDSEHGLGDVALSLPSIVGRDGVQAVPPPVLDEAERTALERSAATLREAAAALDLG
jgi:L-lactate dehydrogenase